MQIDGRHVRCVSLSECLGWLACSQFEVKDVAWDESLGAERLDLILLNHFADEFQKKHGFDIRTSPKAIAKLKRQVITSLYALCIGLSSVACLFWILPFG